MIAQRTGAVFDGMLVNRAVGMNMRNDVALGVPVQRRMVVAVRARCRLCDEGGLKGKRHRRRHRDDVGKMLKKGPCTAAQTHTLRSFRHRETQRYTKLNRAVEMPS
jgi:hypothetical protein